MKRLSIFAMVLAAFVLLPNCSRMDIGAVKQMDDVAVVTIGVNKYINMGDFNGMTSIIQRLAQNDKFDLNPSLDMVHRKTFGEYKQMFPFQLVPEQEVLSKTSYQQLEAFKNENVDDNIQKYVLSPDGYQAYNPYALKERNVQKILDAVPEGSDGIMILYVEYYLQQHKVPFVATSTYSKASVEARVTIEVYDNEAEKVMKVIKKGESDERMKVVVGAMLEPDQIAGLCMNATEKAMNEVDTFIEDKLAS